MIPLPELNLPDGDTFRLVGEHCEPSPCDGERVAESPQDSDTIEMFPPNPKPCSRPQIDNHERR